MQFAVTQGRTRVKKTLGPAVPNFKNSKVIVTWKNPKTGQTSTRLMTKTQHQKWMDLATRSIDSQLRCAFPTLERMIRTAAQPRSLIASFMPLDDGWTWIPELHVLSELCAKGQEGATILIERIK